MAETIVINSEQDLWDLLNSSFKAEKIPSTLPFEFGAWQPRLFYFPTEPIGHSLSPSLARAITGFHSSLSRAYAYALYGQANARLLKALDEDVLEFHLLTIAGSSGIEIDKKDLARLLLSLLHKMSGHQVTKLVALIALLIGSTTVMKSWIHEEYEFKQHEVDGASNLKLSEQETKRMQLLSDAFTTNPNWIPFKDITDEARVPLVRGTLAYERAEVLGVKITRDQAKAIVTKERDKAVGRRLDGRFDVIDINVDNPEGWFGVLRNQKTHQDIRVSINFGELPEEDRHILFTALEGKGSVDALVNAWMLGDKVTYASVVRANKVP